MHEWECYTFAVVHSTICASSRQILHHSTATKGLGMAMYRFWFLKRRPSSLLLWGMSTQFSSVRRTSYVVITTSCSASMCGCKKPCFFTPWYTYMDLHSVAHQRRIKVRELKNKIYHIYHVWLNTCILLDVALIKQEIIHKTCIHVLVRSENISNTK